MRTVLFAGYSWSVKRSEEAVGPGPNLFSDSPENVWVDDDHRLHLRITERRGRWLCAEVILAPSLGHGTYRFALESPVGNLDPNVVLGLFTWDDDSKHDHREIDIEFIRHSPMGSANAQYVVQPAKSPGHRHPFQQPPWATSSAHSFNWDQRFVTFASSTTGGWPIATWRFTGAGVPPCGGEHARINLWLNGGKPPVNGAEAEVVLATFSFTPG